MVEVTLNLQDLALEAVQEGNRFEARVAKAFGVRLGLFGVGATLYEVPPGKVACPFHRHHTTDEMFLILSGAGTYRYGEQRLAVHAGDCLGAPAGAEAHQIINTGTEALRYLAVSNNTNADVIEFLDSGRIRIDIGATGHHRENATFAAGGRLVPMGYWDGEQIDD
jgi:uncharacterized cupin superfamily protein